jgi:hypothetical protein
MGGREVGQEPDLYVADLVRGVQLTTMRYTEEGSGIAGVGIRILGVIKRIQGSKILDYWLVHTLDHIRYLQRKHNNISAT